MLESGISPRNALVLFTKPARPGTVKTRLIGELSPEQAAELHAAFFDDLCARLRHGSFHLRIAWALEPGDEVPAGDVEGVRQQGSDLGERLFRALHAASHRFEAVAAVGSDHPELGLETVEEAFRRLAGDADVVLGPAADGGYYLIGLGRAALRRELFADVAWSTDAVLRQTLERARRLDLRVSKLAEGHDVDLPADLERLAGRLRENDPGCPRTRALLAAWGRLDKSRPMRSTA